MKRTVDILVISDLHLGTFGSQAQNFLRYLDSVEPKQLIINGDLIDIWQFMRWYFPKSHLQILQKIAQLISSGIPVYYLTGNHDDLLRKFTPLSLGNFQLIDNLELDIDGKRTLIFHGDKYDKTIKAQLPAIVGGLAYHSLIVLDRLFNKCWMWFGFSRIRISKGLKDFTKKAAKKVGDFEQDAIDEAIEKGYDYLICGHIHKPQIRTGSNDKGTVEYLNSGDWVENATALEYIDGNWQLFYYEKWEQ
ncbi:MAG: UDP-2,3-diacylglucosamine diphosphatase [Saprospiraceae bacterium]